MIKAIETSYKGYRFRSRLEARWAVFFDSLGVKWEYELEGYALPSGRKYLPDFMVNTPQGGYIFYDVKGAISSDDGKLKELHNALFAEYKNNDHLSLVPRCAILIGDPVEHIGRKTVENNGYESVVSICPRCGIIEEPAYGFGETYYGCESCDFETPIGGGHPYEVGFLGFLCTPSKGHVCMADGDYSRLINRVKKSAIAARSARFEHGECGATA